MSDALLDRLGYITEEDVLRLLNIKAGTGRNRQCRGLMPPYSKVGHQKLYKIADIEEWIAEHRVAAQ